MERYVRHYLIISAFSVKANLQKIYACGSQTVPYLGSGGWDQFAQFVSNHRQFHTARNWGTIPGNPPILNAHPHLSRPAGSQPSITALLKTTRRWQNGRLCSIRHRRHTGDDGVWLLLNARNDRRCPCIQVLQYFRNCLPAKLFTYSLKMPQFTRRGIDNKKFGQKPRETAIFRGFPLISNTLIKSHFIISNNKHYGIVCPYIVGVKAMISRWLTWQEGLWRTSRRLNADCKRREIFLRGFNFRCNCKNNSIKSATPINHYQQNTYLSPLVTSLRQPQIFTLSFDRIYVTKQCFDFFQKSQKQ